MLQPTLARVLGHTAALVLVASLVTSGFPQTTTTGAISGTVRDSSGAVLPGVSVGVTSRTGESRSVVSDDRGTYSFRLLSPGAYRVEFSLSGFQTVIRDAVAVQITETVALDQTLQVAQRQESVTVSAQGEMLQTRSSALGRVVDSDTITSLPLATRNFTQLTSLSPGTFNSVPDTLAVGSGSQNVFSNGGAQLSNAYTLNGAQATNSLSSSAAIDFGMNGVAVPSVESIQEFKVQTAVYDAAFGMKAGANINVVTKSGTSELHGSAYEFYRDDALNANSFFFNKVGAHKAQLRQHQFGATLGGPIVKDRFFFFGSYEGTRQLNGASQSSQRTLVLPAVPLDRSRASLGRAFAGQTGVQGGLAVDASGANIHSVAFNLLNAKRGNGEFLIPSPQLQGAGANYAVSVPALYDSNQTNANLDYQVTSKNRLSGKYFFSRAYQEEGFFQTDLPGFPNITPTGNQNFVLSDSHVISSDKLNEVRAYYTRFTGANRQGAEVTDTAVGMKRPTQDVYIGLPRMDLATFGLGFGNAEVVSTTNIVGISDIFSFSVNAAGRHDIRIGSNTQKEQDVLDVANQRRGRLTFQSFADFLIGRAGTAVAQGGNGSIVSNVNRSLIATGLTYKDIRQFDQSLFIADDWKVNRRLSLNLGLRWELLGNLSDARGALSNFDPRRYQPPPAGGVTSAGLVQPENTEFALSGVPKVGKNLLDSDDYNNFAPRFGFAFRPRANGNVVLRGGYGVFYERPQTRPNITALGLQSAPFNFQLDLRAAANRAADLAAPFGTVPALSAFPIAFEIPSPSTGSAPIAFAFLNPENRMPYIQNYSLNLQYSLRQDWLVEAGYVGSKGTRLPTAVEINQSLLASAQNPVNGLTSNSAANGPSRTPFVGIAHPGLSSRENTGTSNFHSLQGSLTKRFSRGISFLTSYTYAKSLSTVDTGDEFFAARFQSGTQDQRNIRGDGYGPSNFDRTQRFVTSFMYRLPGPGGKGLLERLAGGWELGGIVVAQSGLPFSVTDANAGTLYGGRGGRASFAEGASIATARLEGSVAGRLNRYFNTSAFARAATYAAGTTLPGGFPVSGAGTVFGNTGRNLMRGPGQKNLDLALIKRTRLRERAALEFRSEFFNILNHPNFGLPSAEMTAADFGVISTTSSAPRVMQFALKLSF